MAKLIPGTDPVHKVTIIPRGMALGLTQQLPVDDRHNYSRKFLENTLAMLFGGRVAEELVLDQLTTGASNDIQRATKMARNMVCQWGMSDKFGPLSFSDGNQQVFLGRDFMQHKDYSDETARLIDDEIRRFVDEGYQRAKKLLSENLGHLHKIAEALLERESLSGAEIDLILQGEPLPPLVEEGVSPKAAAQIYSEMSRKFGDTPPPPAGQAGQADQAGQAGQPAQAAGAPAQKDEGGEFKLEEAPPPPVKKPFREEE